MKLNHSALLVVVLTFGLVLTSALMFVSFHYLVEAKQEGFNKQSNHLTLKFEEELEDVRDEIRGLSTIFYAMDHINSDALRINSEHTFSQHHTIQKMLFAQRVSHQQRAHFEAEKHEEGFISFAIHDFKKSSSGAIHDSYLPITQVEPFDVDNISLLGANLSGSSDFLDAITDAIKTGNDVSLVTKLGDEDQGLWLFKAIYSGYSGQDDPYFAQHSEDMVNGIIGIKADITSFLHLDSSSLIKIKLTVQDQKTGLHVIPFSQAGWQDHPSAWAGLSFTHNSTFTLKNQDIMLQTQQILPWFDQVFLLFLLSACIGLGFTALLVFSTRAMLESERRNSAVLHSALDAIISIDEHSIIQEFNPAAERIFGFQRDQVIGKNVVESMIPQAQRQLYNAGMQHYLSTNEQHVLGKQLEMTALKANGETIPVELNIVEVTAGKHRIFTAFLRDTSARKKAQSELARLATVVKQCFNGILITDTHGIIQYVNPAFEKMSGYSADEALGQRPNIVKSGEHNDQYYADLWQTIAAGNSWTDSFINRNKNGQIYYVEQSISPLYLDGECVGYASVQQDVTERNQLQAQSEHTQRLESLGVLAGGIAHDFNNLLTVILGNASLAHNKLGAESPVAKQLNHIQQASKSAATLCQQMLAYSGQGQFIIQPINISSIIADIMQLLESSISKLAKLDIQLEQNLPAIDADEGQIKQVIMNLVINASEAIGDHSGNIHVSTTQCHLQEHDLIDVLGHEALPTGDYIHLQIRDDGCGMNEEIMKRIFDPFFTTKFTGRGLGMSAILGIIRGHSGGISLTSQPKKGTCFDIYFPVSDAPNKPPPTTITASPSIEHKHGNVLVVDDEELLREIAQCILDDIGIDTIFAEDGLQALELLQDECHHIDLVILDMTMPNMGGEACYKQLRSFAPDLPVIICSGYAEQEVREHFDTNKHLDYLQKPYLPEQLINKVQNMLANSDYS